MEQIKNIIHRHGLAVIETVNQVNENSPATGFSLGMFVPNGNALIISEEISVGVVTMTLSTGEGKERTIGPRQRKKALPETIVTGANALLCDLESFEEKLRIPTQKVFQLAYSAVVVAPEAVVQINYEVVINPNFGPTVEDTELAVGPWSMMRADGWADPIRTDQL